MYNNNLAYNTYTQNNAGVESPAKLIEMLYEGLLRFNVQAKHAIKNDDIEKRSYWINRSIAIFSELLSTLDFNKGGNVAQYLSGLYTYQLQQLTYANMHNDPAKIDEVNLVVKGLLEAWRDETQK